MKKLLVTAIAAALFVVACNKPKEPTVVTPRVSPEEVGVACANFIADSIRDNEEPITNEYLMYIAAECALECDKLLVAEDVTACETAHSAQLEKRVAEAQAEVDAAQGELGADPIVEEQVTSTVE